MTHFSRVCNQELLNRLCLDAKHAPRKRTHFEMHAGMHDPIQKFLNVMQIGSYIPPHLHRGEDRWESFQIIQGTIKAIIFNAEGKVLDTTTLNRDKGPYIVELPGDVWHAIVALEKDSALLELKPGPYDPEAAKYFAHWAPPEGDKQCVKFVHAFEKCQIGDFIPDLI